jgi:Domain of unknown function (DUF5134)
MAHPTWLPYGFAVLMVAVSVYCIGRLALARRLGRRNHYDINLSHVLMGFAMVGMLVPRWNLVPDRLWETVFGIVAVYFLAMSVRSVGRRGAVGTVDDHGHHSSHNLIHTAMACAMLYMYWLGMPITSLSRIGMSMSGIRVGAGDASLTLVIVVVLIASAVWQLDSISLPSASRRIVLSTVGVGAGVAKTGAGAAEASLPGDARPWLAPRLEVACHVAMCVAMGYMLVLMV